MNYDCLIIDDEKMLADSTAEYFNLFDVKTAALYSACEYLDFLRTNTAKVKAVLRRIAPEEDALYADGRLSVDFASRQVSVGGEPVHLTALEFRLLTLSCFSRSQIPSKNKT